MSPPSSKPSSPNIPNQHQNTFTVTPTTNSPSMRFPTGGGNFPVVRANRKPSLPTPKPSGPAMTPTSTTTNIRSSRGSSSSNSSSSHSSVVKTPVASQPNIKPTLAKSGSSTSSLFPSPQIITSTTVVVSVRDDPQARKKNQTSYLSSIQPKFNGKKSGNHAKHQQQKSVVAAVIEEAPDVENIENDDNKTEATATNNNNNNNNIHTSSSAEVAQIVRGVGVQNFFKTKAKIEFEEQQGSDDDDLDNASSTSSENSMSTISSDTHSSDDEKDKEKEKEKLPDDKMNAETNKLANESLDDNNNGKRRTALELMQRLADGRSHRIEDFLNVIDTAKEDLIISQNNNHLHHHHHHHHKNGDSTTNDPNSPNSAKMNNDGTNTVDANGNANNTNNNSKDKQQHNRKLNISLPMKIFNRKESRVPCAMITVSARLHSATQLQQQQQHFMMNYKKGKKIFGAQFSAYLMNENTANNLLNNPGGNDNNNMLSTINKANQNGENGGAAADDDAFSAGFDPSEELLLRMTAGKGRREQHMLRVENNLEDDDELLYAMKKDKTIIDEAEIRLRRAGRVIRKQVNSVSRTFAEAKTAIEKGLEKALVFHNASDILGYKRDRLLDGGGGDSSDEEPEIYSGFDIRPRTFKAPNAYTLDNPSMMGVRRRKIVSVPSYRSSIIAFAGKQETAQDLDRQFILRHPFCKPLNLKLSEIRAIKSTMLQIALNSDHVIDVATIAYAVCYMERLIMRKLVNDRALYLVAATCLLIACKFNEGALFEAMKMRIKYVKEKCHEHLNVSGQEMLAAEPHVLVALKFELHVHETYVKRHWVRLLGSVNLLPAEYLMLDGGKSSR